MQKIKLFILKNFVWIFPVLLIGCIIMSTLLLKDNGCLQNVYSPRGITSLQTTTSSTQVDSIIAYWKKEDCYCHKPGMMQGPCDEHTQCRKAIFYAIKNIKTDFWFIPLYVSLLLILLMRLNRKFPFTQFLHPLRYTGNEPGETIVLANWLLSIFVVAAGICDMIENIFLLKTLNEQTSKYHESFLLPSLIKLVLLASVVVYVLLRASPWITRFFRRVVQLLWRLRIAVFSLLLLALPLWLTDQGQDLLANINNTHSGPIGVFITLSVLAALNWHLPKMYWGTETAMLKNMPETTQKKFSLKQLITRNWDDESTAVESEKKAGRMFGILTFLVPSCAISNALDVFKADHFFKFISPVALLVLLTLLFYIVIRYNWLEHLNRYITENLQNWKGKMLRFLLTFFIVVAIGIIILPVFGNSSAAKKLTVLQVNLMLLAVLFLLFTEYRKTRWFSIWFTGTRLNKVIWGASALCITVFIVFNFDPMLLTRINRSLSFRVEATPLLICAIIFHTVFFSLLLLYGRRFKTDIISIFLVAGLAITLTGSNNFHTVRRVVKESSLPAEKMATFKEHLKAWLMHRREEINNYDTAGGRKYPFFLVNSYGGGIRAAAWTSMLFSRIDRQLQSNTRLMARKEPANLNHYTFAVSGISGGTVGLAVHTAYINRELARSPVVRPYDSATLFEFYQSDFLSPVTTVLLGRDILASALGVESWNDRAAILEKTWERKTSEHELGYLDVPFRNIWNTYQPGTRYEIPLLFSNSFHAEEGVPGILAPVQLDEADFPSATLVNKLAHIREQDLRLSTAAFISARFPYVTPSARFSYGHHFIDGGAKEYSGCATLLQVYQLIEKTRKEDPFIDSMMRKVQVYHFNIKNYVPREEEEKKVSNPFEVTLPLTAIIQASYGTTQEAIINIETAIKKENSFMVQPTVEFINDEASCKNRYSPVLPLGWKISKEALQRMWKSIDREEQTANSGLQRLLNVFK